MWEHTLKTFVPSILHSTELYKSAPHVTLYFKIRKLVSLYHAVIFVNELRKITKILVILADIRNDRLLSTKERF